MTTSGPGTLSKIIRSSIQVNLERVDRLVILPPVPAQQIVQDTVALGRHAVGGTSRPRTDLLGDHLREQCLVGHLAQGVINRAWGDVGPLLRTQLNRSRRTS